jgi:hypothetical protein
LEPDTVVSSVRICVVVEPSQIALVLTLVRVEIEGHDHPQVIGKSAFVVAPPAIQTRNGHPRLTAIELIDSDEVVKIIVVLQKPRASAGSRTTSATRRSAAERIVKRLKPLRVRTTTLRPAPI